MKDQPPDSSPVRPGPPPWGRAALSRAARLGARGSPKAKARQRAGRRRRPRGRLRKETRPGKDLKNCMYLCVDMHAHIHM